LRWFELKEFEDADYPPLILLKRLARRGVATAPTFWAPEKDEHSPPWDLSPWPLIIHGLPPAATDPIASEPIVRTAQNPGQFEAAFDAVRRSVRGGIVYVQPAFDGDERCEAVYRRDRDVPPAFRGVAAQLRRAVPSDVPGVRLLYVEKSGRPVVLEARPVDEK
jgi:hypothetical protein